MEHTFTVKELGILRSGADGFRLELRPAYRTALSGLKGFSHVQILWWFSGCGGPVSRSTLTVKKPYTKGPDLLGVFSTRSPERPNPIALSCAEVAYLDLKRGTIGLAYLDADDGSPVLDIKPYTPSLDRVEHPRSPAWCAHWPKNVETSGSFPWENEFNF